MLFQSLCLQVKAEAQAGFLSRSPRPPPAGPSRPAPAAPPTARRRLDGAPPLCPREPGLLSQPPGSHLGKKSPQHWGVLELGGACRLWGAVTQKETGGGWSWAAAGRTTALEPPCSRSEPPEVSEGRWGLSPGWYPVLQLDWAYPLAWSF